MELEIEEKRETFSFQSEQHQKLYQFGVWVSIFQTNQSFQLCTETITVLLKKNEKHPPYSNFQVDQLIF
jgi:hypothetical protein